MIICIFYFLFLIQELIVKKVLVGMNQMEGLWQSINKREIGM